MSDENRISDWSSDVCSSDLVGLRCVLQASCLVELLILDQCVIKTDLVAEMFCGIAALTDLGCQHLFVQVTCFLGLFQGQIRGGHMSECIGRYLNTQIGRASCRESVCKYV